MVQFIAAFCWYRYNLEFCQKMKIKVMRWSKSSNLHQYVPTVKYVEDCFIPSTGVTTQVPKASLHPIIIGGDQLTAARARGAKKAKLHVDSPISRLEGLIPVAEDWHTKVVLLEVSDINRLLCRKRFNHFM